MQQNGTNMFVSLSLSPTYSNCIYVWHIPIRQRRGLRRCQSQSGYWCLCNHASRTCTCTCACNVWHHARFMYRYCVGRVNNTITCMWHHGYWLSRRLQPGAIKSRPCYPNGDTLLELWKRVFGLSRWYSVCVCVCVCVCVWPLHAQAKIRVVNKVYQQWLQLV